MTNHDNTNRGAIWNNDKKTTEKHPDLTGTLDVEGVQYWVSAWKKATGGNPKAPVLSFSVKRKDSMAPADLDTSRPTAAPRQEKPVEGESGAPGDDFDSIPF